MKTAAIALALLMSVVLLGEGFEASGRTQTDWYSRGIIRQQTINLNAHQKKQQTIKRKRRKAHPAPRRHKH